MVAVISEPSVVVATAATQRSLLCGRQWSSRCGGGGGGCCRPTTPKPAQSSLLLLLPTDAVKPTSSPSVTTIAPDSHEMFVEDEIGGLYRCRMAEEAAIAAVAIAAEATPVLASGRVVVGKPELPVAKTWAVDSQTSTAPR